MIQKHKFERGSETAKTETNNGNAPARTEDVQVTGYPKKAVQAHYDCVCPAPDNPAAIRAYKELISKLVDLLNHE